MRQMPEEAQDFGARLQYLREKKRISRRVLADFMAVSKITITRYELGERIPDIAVAIRLADFFDITVDELLGKK